jgi:hypothetical protein
MRRDEELDRCIWTTYEGRRCAFSAVGPSRVCETHAEHAARYFIAADLDFYRADWARRYGYGDDGREQVPV